MHKKLAEKIFQKSSELAVRTANLKSNGKKVVFTNGCFDLIHPGHVDYLYKARDLGDFLVIGVNSDASVSRLKGTHRPIQNEYSRLQVLAALGCVDALVIFNEETPLRLISELLPDVLVKGGDYTFDSIVGADQVMKNGGNVEIIPFLEGYSTSSIEAKIKAQP